MITRSRWAAIARLLTLHAFLPSASNRKCSTLYSRFARVLDASFDVKASENAEFGFWTAEFTLHAGPLHKINAVLRKYPDREGNHAATTAAP